MGDEEEAAFYQAHKDDPEVWGEPVRPKLPKRRLSCVVSVRFSPAELDLLRECAPQNLSRFIRLATLEKARGPIQTTPLPAPSTLPTFIYRQEPGEDCTLRLIVEPRATNGGPSPTEEA